MVKTIWKNRELRMKIIRTFFMLLAIRILGMLPTPGVSPGYFKAMLEANASLGFLNQLTGNGLGTLSITALGVTPYITASIVIQLLGVCFHRIRDMQGDKDGQEKLQRITLITSAGFAFVEGIMMAAGFGASGMLREYRWYWVLITAVIWTAASTILSAAGLWMTKEKDKFVGNGISLILLMNIVSAYPQDARSVFDILLSGASLPLRALGVVAIAVLVFVLFAFSVYIQNCEKRIPVKYSQKTVGNMDYIPLKLCPGSVVPVVFASSVLAVPVLIAEATGHSLNLLNTGAWFDPQHPAYSIGVLLYIALIFFFSYFYSWITVNPEEIADGIRKAGGNIPGIRAGKPTAEYIRSNTRAMIGIGAGLLTVIAVVPLVIGGVFGLTQISFLGTSVIITSGVILETWKEIKSQARPGQFSGRKGGLFYQHA